MKEEKLLKTIIKIAENNKAKDIKAINLSNKAPNLVIMSGESSPQLKAISREIIKGLG